MTNDQINEAVAVHVSGEPKPGYAGSLKRQTSDGGNWTAVLAVKHDGRPGNFFWTPTNFLTGDGMLQLWREINRRGWYLNIEETADRVRILDTTDNGPIELSVVEIDYTGDDPSVYIPRAVCLAALQALGKDTPDAEAMREGGAVGMKPDFTCPQCGGHAFSTSLEEQAIAESVLTRMVIVGRRCDNDTNGQPLDASLPAFAQRLKSGESEPVRCGWDSREDES